MKIKLPIAALGSLLLVAVGAGFLLNQGPQSTAAPGAATKKPRVVATPRKPRVRPGVTETPTVVYLDEENVIDFESRDRPAVEYSLGKFGSVLLPPGWGPGEAVGLNPDGTRIQYEYIQDSSVGSIIMFDSETGKIIKETAGPDASAAERDVFEKVLADFKDGK